MMRVVQFVPNSLMDDWRAICKAFAKRIDAELIFVNETGCGVELKDGNFRHFYVDELQAYLETMNKEII